MTMKRAMPNEDTVYNDARKQTQLREVKDGYEDRCHNYADHPQMAALYFGFTLYYFEFKNNRRMDLETLILLRRLFYNNPEVRCELAVGPGKRRSKNWCFTMFTSERNKIWTKDPEDRYDEKALAESQAYNKARLSEMTTSFGSATTFSAQLPKFGSKPEEPETKKARM